MCGRYVLAEQVALAERFKLTQPLPQMHWSYNIKPTQTLPVVTQNETGERGLESMRWGLIPRWKPKPGTKAPNLFNARSETVAEKASFRNLIGSRRCLVPASGFYEWRREEDRKQPFYFSLRETTIFAFAGLYDRSQADDGEESGSYTILTTQPNTLLANVHDRMPVILRPEDEEEWLSTQVTDPRQLERFYVPYPAEAMLMQEANPKLNQLRSNGPELIHNSQ